MFELEPEAFIMTALILYPGIIESLIRKAGQKQISAIPNVKHFQGYQKKSWNEILAHELFTTIGDDMSCHDYPWLLNFDERSTYTEEKQSELA